MKMKFKASRLVNKAYSCLEKENFSGALTFLKKAQEADPSDDEVLAYLGEVCIYNEKYQEAKDAFDKRDTVAIKNVHLNPYVEGYRGRIFLEQGEWDKAEELINKAIDEKAIEPEVLYSKALLQLHKNQFNEALSTMRKIEEHEPAFYHKKINTLMKKLSNSI